MNNFEFKYLQTQEYYKRYCLKITPHEALYLLDQGNVFIGAAGYTYFSDGGDHCNYFAAGTYPSCTRGGAFPSIKHLENLGDLYFLTLKDVILTHGYYPCIYSGMELSKYQLATEDFSVDLRELQTYVTNSTFTEEDFKSSFRSPRIWQEYFYNKGKGVYCEQF